MSYHFRVAPEVVRAIVIAMLGPVLAALATLDPAKLDNWRVWGISLGIAVVHAGLTALLAQLSSQGSITKS